MKALIRTSGLLVLFGALLALPMAHADELQDAVTKLLADDANSIVIVEFDLKRIDGKGGREVSLQGAFVAEDLVLVTNAKSVDPDVGGQFHKPEKITIRLPGDVKKEATFVGKDDELNLALLKLVPEETDDAEPESDDGKADETDIGHGGNGAPPMPEEKDSGEEPAEEEDEEEPFVPKAASFAFDGEIVPGQPLLVLRRLGQADDDLVTFSTLRVTTVIPRPGLPTEYRMTGNLRSAEGNPVFAHSGELVGFVAASTLSGGGGWRIVNGQVVRVTEERTGFPTRLLHAKLVREFLADPKRHARRDSWLGVKDLQALSKPLAEAYGVEKPGGIVVGDVSKKSPAEEAGFEASDVIVAIDGEAVETVKDRDLASFKRRIRLEKAGQKMTFKVARAGEKGVTEVELVATIQESPLSESEVPEYHDEKFGLKLKPLTRDFLERSRLSVDLKGVRVVSVEPASWASIAGIQTDDVIRKMVLKPCENLDQYKEIMAELDKTRDSEVCYNVMRSRKSLFLCVRPDWSTVDKGL